jgi:hypothetical protein
MRSRFDMIKMVGIGRALALAGTSLALYAVASLAILAFDKPAETGQALMDFVSPTAQAAALTPGQPSASEVVLPTSAQAKSWDKVEYGEHDFDPRPGQIED